MKFLAIAAVALCVAAPLNAQIARAGLSVGAGGGGPLGIVSKAGSLDIHVWRSFGMTAGIASLSHGNGVCNHSIPNRCDGSAETWSLGAFHAMRASERVRIRTSLSGGQHDFSGIHVGGGSFVARGSRPLIAGEVSSEIRVIGGLGVHLALQQTVVLNDSEYQTTLGERLRYRLLLLGVSFTL